MATPLLEEYTIQSNEQRIRDLEYNLRWRNEELRTYTSRAQDAERSRQNLTEQIATFNQYREQWETDNLPHALYDMLRRAFRTYLDATQREVDHAEHYARQAENMRTQLAQSQVELARLKARADETNVIRLAELRTQLGELPFIRNRSVSMTAGQRAGGGAVITMTFTGIVMQPDKNPYEIIDEGKLPHIALDDLKVKLFFPNNRIRITHGSRQRAGVPRFYAPHPHVLDGHVPCLGDFEPPVNKAMRDGDIVTTALLLQAFFQQANHDDGAGMRWFNWIHNALHKELAALGITSFTQLPNGYKIRTQENGTIQLFDKNGELVTPENAAAPQEQAAGFIPIPGPLFGDLRRLCSPEPTAQRYVATVEEALAL